MSAEKKNNTWRKLKRQSDKNLRQEATDDFTDALAEKAAMVSCFHQEDVNRDLLRLPEEGPVSLEPQDLMVCDDIPHSPNYCSNQPPNEQQLQAEPFCGDESVCKQDFAQASENVTVSDDSDSDEFEYECESYCESDFQIGAVPNFNLEINQHEDIEGRPFNLNLNFKIDQNDNIGRRLLNEEDTNDSKLRDKLALWSMKHHVGRNALTDLLGILIDSGHENLPRTSQSLLKTPRNTSNMIKAMDTGFFWYRGILEALKPILNEKYIETLNGNILKATLFVDGVSPYKSVRRILWPICISPVGSEDIFVVGLWCGETKEPNDVHAFFEDFVADAEKLRDGFIICGKMLHLEISEVIADAPARAWVKMVNQHGAYYSCDRCTVKGQWFGNRMTYKVSNESDSDSDNESNERVVPRTDESLLNQVHEVYHKGQCPLLPLGVKLKSHFPLEPMHLVYLGVAKRLFSQVLSKEKRKNRKYKLTDNLLNSLSDYSKSLAAFCPSEFARKPRSLHDWNLYKATEFRRILLYDGLVLFKKIPYPEYYKVFLLLSTSIRVLSDPDLLKEFVDDARVLLIKFVEESCKILGQTFVVYNVHHLPYLPDECVLHGTFDNFSAFKFENYLGEMKYLLHAPGRTLTQIVCRLVERAEMYNQLKSSEGAVLGLSQPHCQGPTLILRGKQFLKVKTKNFMFRLTSLGDIFCLTENEEVVKIENIIEDDSGVVFIVGRKFVVKTPAFMYQFESSLLSIYTVQTLGNLSMWCLSSVRKKMVVLPVDVCGPND